VAGALRKLSVGLCRGDSIADWASIGALADFIGSAFSSRSSLPTDTYIEQCLLAVCKDAVCATA
jgi:hypothetical protein